MRGQGGLRSEEQRRGIVLNIHTHAFLESERERRRERMRERMRTDEA